MAARPALIPRLLLGKNTHGAPVAPHCPGLIRVNVTVVTTP